MRRRALSAIGALILLVAPGPSFATTWFPKEVECPVCHQKNTFEGIGSYGTYIYEWSSKCQFIFWPWTDPKVLYSCGHCHFTAFLWDFGKVSAEQQTPLRAALEGVELDPASSYWRIPMSERLAVAERVYGVLGLDEIGWSEFYRVLGFHLEAEGLGDRAAEARRKALALAEKAAARTENLARRKELLVVTGAMRSFLGDRAGAENDLLEAQGLSFGVEGEEESSGKDAYLSELVADQLTALREPVSKDGDRCSPVCAPECFRPAPAAPWDRLAREALFRSEGELYRMAREKRAKPEGPGLEGTLPGRIESAPALKRRHSGATLRKLSETFGPPTRVEPQGTGKDAVRRFFWGPHFLVASGEDAIPSAQGLSLVLASFHREQKGKSFQFNGIGYVPLAPVPAAEEGQSAPAATGAIAATEAPAGARLHATAVGGAEFASHGSAVLEGLGVGAYRVELRADGFHTASRTVFVEPGFRAEIGFAAVPIAPWEPLLDEVLGRSLAQLRKDAWAESGDCHAARRWEIAELTPEPPTVAALEERLGKPDFVEQGQQGEVKVRRYFWGPAFVVAADEKSRPLAAGVDFLLEELSSRGSSSHSEHHDVVYSRPLPSADGAGAAGGLRVTSNVERPALEIVGPTGTVAKAVAPWNAASLPPGEYEVRASRRGCSPSVKQVLIEPGFEASIEVRLYGSDCE